MKDVILVIIVRLDIPRCALTIIVSFVSSPNYYRFCYIFKIISIVFKPGEVCTCYKLKTDKTKSKHGTICGIRGYCGGKHILNEGCPHGYRFERNSVLCYKDDESIDDASGTACGYAAPSSSCGNDNSQLCPSGYTATMKSPGVLYYCSKL